jgi:hypothetical protein
MGDSAHSTTIQTREKISTPPFSRRWELSPQIGSRGNIQNSHLREKGGVLMLFKTTLHL